MFVNRRAIIVLALGFLALGSNAENDRDIDNEVEPVPTQRTITEKILQKTAALVTSGDSNDSSKNRTRLGKVFGFLIPKSVKNVGARSFSGIVSLFEKHNPGIFPGTVWCGSGNISSSDVDVGVFKKTDECCRVHDHCPSNIQAGEIMGRLWNNGAFTRSNCFCDNEFYECLKNVDSVISNRIGETYFNILKPQCFAYEYPIEYCSDYKMPLFGRKKCLEYKLDDQQIKKLQWFDNLDY